jgi:putative AlgH/UPF0301 family transcriptional regulator
MVDIRCEILPVEGMPLLMERNKELRALDHIEKLVPREIYKVALKVHGKQLWLGGPVEADALTLLRKCGRVVYDRQFEHLRGSQGTVME